MTAATRPATTLRVVRPGMVAKPPRSVPLRVPISDGEALDSWMDRVADRNGVSTRGLVTALGLPAALNTARGLIEHISADTLRRIEDQCGQPTHRLDQAVLEAYAPTGWPSLSGSRYCPACLADTGGVWSLRWRLTWVFACTRHRCLLLGRCPDCGRTPRTSMRIGAGPHPAGCCPNGNGRRHACRAPLHAAAAIDLDNDGPAIAAQRWIDQRLDTTVIDHVAGNHGATDHKADAVAELVDLHALADWIRAYAYWRRRVVDSPGPRQAAPPDRVRRNTIQAGEAGAVVVHALKLLTTDDDALRHELTVLFLPARRAGRTDGIGLGYSNHWAATLPQRHSVRFIRAVDAQMAPMERLRWRSPTGDPRPPRRGAAADDRVRHVPQLLWHEWLIRLHPGPGFFAHDFRAAMARCLLLPGRLDRDLTLISAELHPHYRTQAKGMLRHLCVRGHANVLHAICLLADYLDTHGSQIDYRRRRHLITADLLTEQQWADLCAEAVAHPGQPRRFNDARRYLFTLLTGADLNDRCHQLAFRNPADRSKYSNFTLSMNAALRAVLDRHALGHLHRLGIDEPLTWSPPAECCIGIVLPGREPDDIDFDAVRGLTRDGCTPGAVADRLGTSIEHIRYALAKAAPEPDPSPGWLLHQQAPRMLTREFFQREYIDEGKSLRDLESETGFTREALARHAKRAGITLRNARIPFHIDRDWLEEQYVHRRRPFNDIAAELGTDDMIVINAARRHGIVSRPSGIFSHPDFVTIHEHLPRDVRSAVEGHLHGWQRLHRFQQAMRYPTLNVAAKAIPAEPSALVTQLQRLERDIGAKLLDRATPARAMQLTDRGAALLADLQHPDIQALIAEYGQPPRGKRQLNEKASGDKPMRKPVQPGPKRHVR